MARDDGLRSLYGHTAVWTGREMVVWGGVEQPPGVPCGGLVGAGGVYDPETDRWRLTPPDAAPSPRWRHSAVWDGRAMIVWGGSDYNACMERGGVFSDGAAFLPGGGWEPVAVDHAPWARRDVTVQVG